MQPGRAGLQRGIRRVAGGMRGVAAWARGGCSLGGNGTRGCRAKVAGPRLQAKVAGPHARLDKGRAVLGLLVAPPARAVCVPLVRVRVVVRGRGRGRGRVLTLTLTLT